MTETPPPHAADLIARAEAATTHAELDEIESLAADRVTVLEAVDKRREQLEQAPPEAGVEAVVAAPTEAPPEMESLAEKVYRESHTVPESTTPSDVVPNRPNIRAPGTEEVEPEPEVKAV